MAQQDFLNKAVFLSHFSHLDKLLIRIAAVNLDNILHPVPLHIDTAL
jgi:hypothetical protein